MRPSAIVEIEVATDRRACFGHAVVGVQIDLLVFDAAPQPLDGHVVRQAPLPSMLMVMPWPRSAPMKAAPVNWLP